MKVIAFNGSPQANGNTAQLIRMVFAELEKEGIETELVQIGTKPIQGCVACKKCFENKNKKCIFNNDPVNGWIEKMLAADGIIFGSPTYCCNLPGPLKSFYDRAALVAKANEDMFKRKIGAAVVAVRRCGAAHVFSSLNYFFTINQMIIPGASYWNQGIGLNPGDVEEDAEGVKTMINLGQNMAWLLKNLSKN